MRRSKSNPAKYATNYRKISQCHMTTGEAGGGGGDIGSNISSNQGNKRGGDDDGNDDYDDNDKKEEEKRLEAIIHKSEMTWKRGLAQSGNYHGDGVSGEKKIEKKTKKRKESVTLSEGKIEQQLYKQIIIDNPNKNDNMLSLLSPELRAQYASRRGGGDDDDDDDDDDVIYPLGVRKSNLLRIAHTCRHSQKMRSRWPNPPTRMHSAS